MTKSTPLTEERFLELVKDLATKEDLADIRSKMATKADLKQGLTEVRTEMKQGLTEVRTEIKASADKVISYIGNEVADIVIAIDKNLDKTDTRITKLESRIYRAN